MAARFVYRMNVSLDLFIEHAHDEQGGGDWMSIGDELHEEFNARAEALTMMVQGRKVFETMESFWDNQRIYTKHLVSVQETWFGKQSEKTIEVLTLGGVVGNLGQSVDGSPKLEQGQQVLLFMARDAKAGLHPIGLSQGVFYLGAQTPKGQLAYRDLDAFGFINDTAASFPRTLEELRVRVKEVLR